MHHGLPIPKKPIHGGLFMKHAATWRAMWLRAILPAMCCGFASGSISAAASAGVPRSAAQAHHFVNYTAILEKRLSKAVTPQNNAAIGILAVGRRSVARILATWKMVNGKYVSIPNRPLERELMLGLGLNAPWFTGPRYEKLSRYLKHRPMQTLRTSHGTRTAAWYAKEVSYAGQIELHALKRPWSEKRFPWLAEWLRWNSPALNKVVRATRLPRFYCPLLTKHPTTGVWGTLMPYLSTTISLSDALCVRAMLELDEHHFKACEADLLATHRLAQLVSRSSGYLISVLVGEVIGSRASEADAAMANAAWIPAKDYLAYEAKLSKLSGMTSIYPAVERVGRFICLDSLQRMGSNRFLAAVRRMPGYPGGTHGIFGGKAWPPRYVKTATATANLILNREAAAIRHHDSLVRYHAYRRFMKWRAHLLAHHNPSIPFQVQAAVGWFTQPFPRAIVIRTRSVAASKLSRAALILAAYRAAHGRYPKTLHQLVPEYIRAIPKDPFTDAHIGYHRGKARVRLWTLNNFVDLRHPPPPYAHLRQFVTLSIPPGRYVWPKVLPAPPP